ncbi:MAG: CoA transferase [Dehalococcoidales bacterium]|nr:MAG: CoA transferase [Dehalococcoidales bacterium]
MAGPLVGIRVLDLGRFIACPFCGMLLADLGAEVIRVERSGGGQDRYLGLLAPTGDSYGFTNYNRNKKGISLNFERTERGREILNELIKRSDVVIENFSPEAARALGITYKDLKKVRQDIIFADISAFGTTGPFNHRLGFDQIAKAMSGAMAVSGFPGPPTKEQTPHIDYMTASLTAVGVVSALYHRERTGEGQMIDTALLQTAVTIMAPTIGEWEIGGKLRQQTGNRSPWIGPSDLYKTKDGRWVMLAIITSSIWRRFCRFIDRDDLAEDPRLNDDLARWEHRDIVDPVVAEWVASKTAEEIMTAAEQVPIPAGICHEQTEVASHPHVKAREMLTEVPYPDGSSKMLVTGLPIRMSGTPTEIQRSFPAVGEHNEEIYCGLLGYSREDLTRLAEEGII